MSILQNSETPPRPASVGAQRAEVASAAPPKEATRPSSTRRRRHNSIGRSLWWFVLPAGIAYLYVVIVPSLQGVFYSLTNWNSGPTVNFVGLDNFTAIFEGDSGPAAIRTLFIALTVVVVQNVLGLALALLLSGRIAGRNILRTIIFAPVVVSALVVGYLFQYIFGAPGTGAINTTLASMGLHEIDFLGNPTSALIIIIVAIVWQYTGVTMVIYLAGLQGVPPELQEAAELDGAGYWKRFWFVTRPLLAPAITVNLMLGLIGGLKIFDQIFAITGGGPGGETETVSTLIYRFFSVFGQYGKAAALALLLALAIGVLSFVQFSVLRKQEQKL